MKNPVFFILIAFVFAACDQKPMKSADNISSEHTKTEIIIRGEAQGTTYTIKYLEEEYSGIKQEIDSVLALIDQSMSTYIPNSTISQLNNGDTVEIDQHFQNVYNLSLTISESTEGAFNPTIGPLIKAWGFDYSDPQRMDSSTVNELLGVCGFDQFELQANTLWKKNEQARINFNAVAQGYSVDVMAEIMDLHQIENYYVELGGELVVKGNNKYGDPWIIGIDLPDGENLERKLANRISLESGGMATSGNYRKFYEMNGERYSHTLNPSIGYPAKNNLLSATVICDNSGKADALATAFMVLGLEKTIIYLEQHPTVDALLIYAEKENGFGTYMTKGVESKLLKED